MITSSPRPAARECPTDSQNMRAPHHCHNKPEPGGTTSGEPHHLHCCRETDCFWGYLVEGVPFADFGSNLLMGIDILSTYHA